MASQVLFETPENVQIAYRTAGLGTRYCAWALDCCFVILVAIGISLAALVLGAAADVSVDSLSRKLGVRSPLSQQEFTAFCLAIGMLAMQLGSLIYFTASELFVRGQTFGRIGHVAGFVGGTPVLIERFSRLAEKLLYPPTFGIEELPRSVVVHVPLLGASKCSGIISGETM